MSAALSRAQWRQTGLWTLLAAVLLGGLWCFRAAPELTHMDFVAGGPGALEFCSAENPQFLPVVDRSSPVAASLRTTGPARGGQSVAAVLTLRTNTGKPIGPRDLLPTGARKMNLLLIDPSLADFQAPALEPGAKAGEWTFVFTPRRGGLYRIFADFTPAATAKEMYASVDLPVGDAGPLPESTAVAPAGPTPTENGGLRLTLQPTVESVRAREPLELNFTLARLDHGLLALQPIDGFPARLVAFDSERTGFVNLRPERTEARPAGEKEVRLTFKVTISDPGKYLIWTRISEGRTEVATPFFLAVVP
jgi:hypothetical protein